jgi:3'(2'), 5'-bisphosphate nucleotidase
LDLSLTLLDRVVSIAYKAGQEIIKIYEKGEPTVQKKSDKSPVTEADLMADQIIQKGLALLSPDQLTIPIVTEESITSTEETIRIMTQEGYAWVVDPLDGTRDFIAKTGDFAVCIALVLNGKPVLGVVHCPWHSITLGGVNGQGAYSYSSLSQNGGTRTSVHCRSFEKESLTLLVSRFHTPKLRDTLEQHFPGCTLKVAGSAYKYCLIALGKADLSVRRSPTSLWDIAAAQCILTEAGGGIVDFAGNPLTYNHGSLINPPLIAHGFVDQKQKIIEHVSHILS